MGLREIREEARLALHEELKVEALYLVEGEAPLAVFVRVHTRKAEVGGVKGTSFGYAETQEIQPSIVFLMSEMPAPETNAIVSVDYGEAYRIDNVLQPDNVTVTAEVHVLSFAKAVGLPLPNEAAGRSTYVVGAGGIYYLADGNTAINAGS